MKLNLNLTPEQKQKLFVALITFFLAVAAVFGYDLTIVQPRERAQLAKLAEPQIGAASIQSPIETSRLVVRTTSDLRGAVTARNTLDVTGAQTNASTLSVTGNVTTSAILKIGTFERFGPGTAISVTNGITNLTALATYQPLTSNGNVTVTTLITSTAFTEGDVVKFINTNATGNIVFTDGAWLVMPGSANFTLGPTDSLELWFDGSKWITVSYSDN